MFSCAENILVAPFKNSDKLPSLGCGQEGDTAAGWDDEDKNAISTLVVEVPVLVLRRRKQGSVRRLCCEAMENWKKY